MATIEQRREALDAAGFFLWPGAIDTDRLALLNTAVAAAATSEHARRRSGQTFATLERLLALRVHLDDCPLDNGALALAPGSHRRGRLTDAQVGELASQFVLCPAQAGDVLFMRPLVAHRSSASSAPRHRRVLHVLYAPEEATETLEWKRPA